jgi:ABC-2 type transport system permease protein
MGVIVSEWPGGRDADEVDPRRPGSLATWLRPYRAIVAARVRMLLQYRAAALAGFGTQLFWGLIKVMVLVAFFESASSPPPMNLAQVLVYVWLGQALLGLLPWNVDAEIAGHIRSGGVAYELLRPLDLYGFWYARTLAFRAAPTLLRMIPMLLFAYFGLPVVGLGEWALPFPDSPASGALFLVSALLTLLLSTAITMVLHVSLIWTLSGEGFNRLMLGVVPVFSGLVIPLPLFPDGCNRCSGGNRSEGSPTCRSASTAGTFLSPKPCSSWPCRRSGACSSSASGCGSCG